MSYKLLAGTTLENAKQYGAIYVRECMGRAEMFMVPAHVVEKLGYIPSFHAAIIMKDQFERELR